MNKLISLSVFVVCFYMQAGNAVGISSDSFKFHAGVGLDTSWTKSDFGMRFDVNHDNFPGTGGYASNKKTINKIGGEFFAGLGYTFSTNWFITGEFNINIKHIKHKHDFKESEDVESDPYNNDDQRISYIDVNHSNELGLSARLGHHFNVCDLYGILGITTKQVNVTYSFDANHIDVRDGEDFSTNYKKRIYGIIIGAGAAKKVSKHISCALEYKCKLYGNANKDIDLRNETKTLFRLDEEHDTAPRNFRVKTDKHELSFRVVVNI